MQFLLNLSGLADVYEQFGALVNFAQMFHLLPHERYELYMKDVERLDMIKCLSDHRKCKSYVAGEKSQ